MLCFPLYLAALTLLAGTAAMKQTFTNSGEMNITTCPITYYGQKYEKVYVTFDNNRFAICFNGLYKLAIKNNCILISGGTADRGHLSVLTKGIPTGSGVHKLLPNLKNAGKCVNIIHLKDSQQSKKLQVELGNFGTQAILAIKTYSGYTNVDVVADAQVNGQTVSKQKFQTKETSKGVIAYVSGCRLSGVVYKTNTTVRDPNICSTVTCDVTGVASALSDCGPMELCQGNGSCALDATCTTTGSTVINFIGRVNFVPDRCGYALMGLSSIPDFRVLGVFQERRRKDISFLDHVILQLDRPGVQISLEQGGRIRLNNKLLAITATAKVIHGVELYKDRKGVTAKISASNYTVSVFFDGNTAQIHMTGPSGASVQGLCGNSTRTLIEERVSRYSATGCEIQHGDTTDSTINCKATNEWCNLLKQTPFTACNMHVDPEPFITACTHTLCKYPAVDGLKCQFLEAYARVCSHHSKVTLEGWRSKSKCSAVPQAFCQDKFCSAHEFCSEKFNGGKTRCACRAIYASKYKSTNTLGEPTVCKQSSASLTLAGCLLEDQGIDYSVLHLNDPTCKGKMDDQNHMVTFSYDSGNTCGTVVMANNSQIIYKNSIMTRNSSMYMITRHNKLHVDFSCFYTQPEIKSMAFKIQNSAINQQIVAGQWIYNLTMAAYTDPRGMHPIQSSNEIQLNERIWVEVKTDGLDGQRLVVVTDSCWATDQPSSSGSLRYDLIIQGCPNPADQTVKVEGNGVGTSNRFSFNMFQFSGKTVKVYLHCRVNLCVRRANNCIPFCDVAVRKRRSAIYVDKNNTLITMAWTN